MVDYLVFAVSPGDVVEAEDGHIEESHAQPRLSDRVTVVSLPASKQRGHSGPEAHRGIQKKLLLTSHLSDVCLV